MIYTQTDLESMSDLALNKIIGKIKGIVKGGKIDSYYERNCPNYCNNWNDCGALIDELCSERTVLSQGKSVHGEYVGYTYGDSSLMIDQDHKRGITIIYILIKQCQK